MLFASLNGEDDLLPSLFGYVQLPHLVQPRMVGPVFSFTDFALVSENKVDFPAIRVEPVDRRKQGVDTDQFGSFQKILGKCVSDALASGIVVLRDHGWFFRCVCLLCRLEHARCQLCIMTRGAIHFQSIVGLRLK